MQTSSDNHDSPPGSLDELAVRRRRHIRVDGAEVLETGLQIADGEDDHSQDFPLPPPQDPPTRPGSSTPLVDGRVDQADAIREKLRTSEQAPAPTTPSFPRGSADLPPSAPPARRTRRLKNRLSSRFGGDSSVGERELDASAAEVDHCDERVGGVESVCAV